MYFFNEAGIVIELCPSQLEITRNMINPLQTLVYFKYAF